MMNLNVNVPEGEGLHLRPAGVLSKLARNFQSEITIKFADKEINAKKMMAIMSAGITAGSSVEITAIGEDESTAIAEIEKFFAGGMQ